MKRLAAVPLLLAFVALQSRAPMHHAGCEADGGAAHASRHAGHGAGHQDPVPPPLPGHQGCHCGAESCCVVAMAGLPGASAHVAEAAQRFVRPSPIEGRSALHSAPRRTHTARAPPTTL